MKRKLHLQFFAEEPVSQVKTEEENSENEPIADVETETSEENSEPSEVSADVPFSEAVMQRIYGHISRLEEETRGLKEIFPDFDLYRELQNPTFARLTAPDSGIHAEDAYYAIHRKEIQSMQREEPKPDVPSPKAVVMRPNENGLSGKAPSVMAFDYRNTSKEHREALKKAIRTAAAKGEKIYPR